MSAARHLAVVAQEVSSAAEAAVVPSLSALSAAVAEVQAVCRDSV